MLTFWLLILSGYSVTVRCHVRTIVANPGGIGGIFEGPDSETIVKGPDGSVITAQETSGIVAVEQKLEPIVVAEQTRLPSIEDGYIATPELSLPSINTLADPGASVSPFVSPGPLLSLPSRSAGYVVSSRPSIDPNPRSVNLIVNPGPIISQSISPLINPKATLTALGSQTYPGSLENPYVGELINAGPSLRSAGSVVISGPSINPYLRSANPIVNSESIISQTVSPLLVTKDSPGHQTYPGSLENAYVGKLINAVPSLRSAGYVVSPRPSIYPYLRSPNPLVNSGSIISQTVSPLLDPEPTPDALGPQTHPAGSVVSTEPYLEPYLRSVNPIVNSGPIISQTISPLLDHKLSLGTYPGSLANPSVGELINAGHSPTLLTPSPRFVAPEVPKQTIDVVEPDPHIIETEIIDAPAFESKESSDLVGPSGSISTRGSESIVSGPASTTITKKAKILVATPVVSIKTPIVEISNEISLAASPTVGSVAQPAIANVGSTIAAPVTRVPFATGLLTGEEWNIEPGSASTIYPPRVLLPTEGPSTPNFSPTTVNPLNDIRISVSTVPHGVTNEGISGFIRPSLVYRDAHSSTVSTLSSTADVNQLIINPADIPSRNIVPPEIGSSVLPAAPGPLPPSNLQGIDVDNIQRLEPIQNANDNVQQPDLRNGYYRNDVIIGNAPDRYFSQTQGGLLSNANPYRYDSVATSSISDGSDARRSPDTDENVEASLWNRYGRKRRNRKYQ